MFSNVTDDVRGVVQATARRVQTPEAFRTPRSAGRLYSVGFASTQPQVVRETPVFGLVDIGRVLTYSANHQ
jgi:hypothetical protein